MSNPHVESTGAAHRKYAGVRQRKWGKWVSEIRVPGTQERLWLGSYSSPEAAAIAHDVAMYCLRGTSASNKLNFPLQRMPSTVGRDMSLQSVQKVASDAGMAVDASSVMTRSWEEDRDGSRSHGNAVVAEGEQGYMTISVDDYL